MPEFLKAGAYYNSKMKNIRPQRFRQKCIVYQILKSEGQRLFAQGEPERAIHKYEEGLCVWRYYICHNPNWEKDGIDDDEIEAVNECGSNSKEAGLINDMKLSAYLNIAVCLLKNSSYQVGVLACNEALKVDS